MKTTIKCIFAALMVLLMQKTTNAQPVVRIFNDTCRTAKVWYNPAAQSFFVVGKKMINAFEDKNFVAKMNNTGDTAWRKITNSFAGSDPVASVMSAEGFGFLGLINTLYPCLNKATTQGVSGNGMTYPTFQFFTPYTISYSSGPYGCLTAFGYNTDSSKAMLVDFDSTTNLLIKTLMLPFDWQILDGQKVGSDYYILIHDVANHTVNLALVDSSANLLQMSSTFSSKANKGRMLIQNNKIVVEVSQDSVFHFAMVGLPSFTALCPISTYGNMGEINDLAYREITNTYVMTGVSTSSGNQVVFAEVDSVGQQLSYQTIAGVNGIAEGIAADPQGTVLISGVTNNGNMFTIAFASTVGINTPKSSEGMKVYPNPAHGYFVIQVPEKTELKIVNASGQIVYEQILTTGKNTISCSRFAPGQYLLLTKEQKNKIIIIQ